MSIPYLNIARAVAARSGQLADAVTAAAFETVYTSELSTALGGMEMPPSELKRMVLASEKRIASICARQKNPILKGGMRSQSESVTSGRQMPMADASGKEWIGTAVDTIVDDSDANHHTLTEKPIQDVLRMNRLYTAGFLRIRPYHYALDGQTIHHTRASVYCIGCVWDYTTQAAAYALAATAPASKAYTQANVDTTNDWITITAHGFTTGLRVWAVPVSTLPSPLTSSTDYYLIVVDANKIRFATSLANALAGTYVNLASPGGASGGTITPKDASGGGSSPLAQECENWWIADTLSMAAQEGWFQDEASRYGQIAEMCKQDAIQGVIPAAVLPDTTATTNPVKN